MVWIVCCSVGNPNCRTTSKSHFGRNKTKPYSMISYTTLKSSIYREKQHLIMRNSWSTQISSDDDWCKQPLHVQRRGVVETVLCFCGGGEGSGLIPALFLATSSASTASLVSSSAQPVRRNTVKGRSLYRGVACKLLDLPISSSLHLPVGVLPCRSRARDR